MGVCVCEVALASVGWMDGWMAMWALNKTSSTGGASGLAPGNATPLLEPSMFVRILINKKSESGLGELWVSNFMLIKTAEHREKDSKCLFARFGMQLPVWTETEAAEHFAMFRSLELDLCFCIRPLWLVSVDAALLWTCSWSQPKPLREYNYILVVAEDTT